MSVIIIDSKPNVMYDDIVTVLQRTKKAKLLMAFDTDKYMSVRKTARISNPAIGWFPNVCTQLKYLETNDLEDKIYALKIIKNDWFTVSWKSIVKTQKISQKLCMVSNMSFIKELANLFGIVDIDKCYTETFEPFERCMSCNGSNDVPHFIICTSCVKIFNEHTEEKISIPTLDDIKNENKKKEVKYISLEQFLNSLE